MVIYIFIFLAKVIENTISTLRLIVVNNGKKFIAAILNLIMSTIWIITTGLVVVNIKADPLKVVFFVLGCFCGSYLGSILEEYIAIGSNLLVAITSSNHANMLKEKLNQLHYPCYILKDIEHDLLFVLVERKNRKHILRIMKQMEPNMVIISQTARHLLMDKIK